LGRRLRSRRERAGHLKSLCEWKGSADGTSTPSRRLDLSTAGWVRAECCSRQSCAGELGRVELQGWAKSRAALRSRLGHGTSCQQRSWDLPCEVCMATTEGTAALKVCLATMEGDCSSQGLHGHHGGGLQLPRSAWPPWCASEGTAAPSGRSMEWLVAFLRFPA